MAQITNSVLEQFDGKRVLVVGDCGLDKYIHGTCARLCPEAPVPVFNPERIELRAGLAGNVATNLTALGAKVKLCSIIGDDQYGVDLQDVLDRAGAINVEKYLGKDSTRPTTVKSRYVSDWHLMLRVDEEITRDFDDILMKPFIQGVIEEVPWADIIVVQDYGKGLISELLMEPLINAAIEHHKIIVVDPSSKQDPTIYSGVDYLKPNEKELGGMMEELGVHQIDVVDRLGLQGLLVTQNSRGMYLLDQGEDVILIPALKQEVHDVCGAGDTVTAVFALSLACGLAFRESAELANMAASIVVGKFGTATLTKEELQGVIDGRVREQAKR